VYAEPLPLASPCDFVEKKMKKKEESMEMMKIMVYVEDSRRPNS
jgi:hypothetical protein